MRRYTLVVLALAAACGGDSGTSTPPPPPGVGSVAVTLSSSTVTVDGRVVASATVRDVTGAVMAGQAVTWSSSAPAVASVSASGQVTALATGSVTIIATAAGVTGSAPLTVTTPPPPPGVGSVAVTLSSSTVVVDGRVVASATVRDVTGAVMAGQAVTWSSSAPAVASVNASGQVTALAMGSATIIATVAGVTGSAPLTVTTPVATVQVSGTLRVKVGDSYSYTAQARLASGAVVQRPVTWQVMESEAATITANGVLVASRSGPITVRATVDGVSGTATLTGYDWQRFSNGTTVVYSLAADVAVSNQFGTWSYPVLTIGCSAGSFAVLVSLSSFVTASGIVSYTFDGGGVISDTWLEGSEFDYLGYPAIGAQAKTFASQIAGSAVFGFGFLEYLGGARVTLFRVSGLTPHLNELLALCPAGSVNGATVRVDAPHLEEVLRDMAPPPQSAPAVRAARATAGAAVSEFVDH